jgi:uncharacterized protein YrrD
MLCNAKSFNRQKLVATDGIAGRVFDVLFHEDGWRIGYVLADVGTWLEGKRILVLPSEVTLVACNASGLTVSLSKAELHRRPHIDTHPSAITPDEIRIPAALTARPAVLEDVIDPCARAGGIPTFSQLLRSIGDDLVSSANQTLGYQVDCSDGSVGLVDDLIMDIDAWTIRYVVLDVGRWLHPRKVILPVSHIGSVLWRQERIVAAVAKDVVLAAPSFDRRHGMDLQHMGVTDGYFGAGW